MCPSFSGLGLNDVAFNEIHFWASNGLFCFVDRVLLLMATAGGTFTLRSLKVKRHVDDP